MKTIFILEDDDEVATSDLCRPLNPSGALELSAFGRNNSTWIPVTEVLGPMWMGKKLGAIKRELTEKSVHEYVFEYEVIRGEVPRDHLLDVDAYKTQMLHGF
jgi:hypothetical protein